MFFILLLRLPLNNKLTSVNFYNCPTPRSTAINHIVFPFSVGIVAIFSHNNRIGRPSTRVNAGSNRRARKRSGGDGTRPRAVYNLYIVEFIGFLEVNS